MQGKVEICGINTARLKVLKSEETRELLVKSRNGDSAAREALIYGNLRLVLSVIQRFGNRGENPDDLFQVGCIGLIKAIDHFDVEQGVQFSTYGVPMIIGEVRRFLRDNNSVRVSRSLRDTAYKAIQCKERLTAEKNREPSIEEIAQALSMRREDVVLALEAIVEPVSLYEPVFDHGGDAIYLMDQVGDHSGDGDWLEEIAGEFPDAFFEELDGGIQLEEEALPDPDFPPGEMYIMGEYCHDMLGRYIVLYYGSFAALLPEEDEEGWKDELFATVAHEFTHHMEETAGLHALDDKDAEFLRQAREIYGDT